MSSYLTLYLTIGLLMIDAVVEVGLVGSMVGFLHARAGKFFAINGPNGTIDLHGKPRNLLVDQGHTSNGAAGTALILVGGLGLLVIWYDKRRARRVRPNTASRVKTWETRFLTCPFQAHTTSHSGIFIFWVAMTVFSALLALAALIYTFVLTAQTDHQSINPTVAAANPEPLFYPLDKWTPENWFIAVLALPLAHDSDRRDIHHNLHLMRGWRWNLIPLFLLGVAVASLALWELLAGRRWRQGDSKEKLRDPWQNSHPRTGERV